MIRACVALALGMLLAVSYARAADVTPARALDKVIFGTGWLAQPEHGGFYQALADGTYRKMGLDVTILPGGPQVPNRARLIAGQIQFMQGTTLGAFDGVAAQTPLVTVAAIFQKDPQAILVHPERHLHSVADLAQLHTLYLAGDGYDTFFQWLKARYAGFHDEQVKPYSYSSAPFIVDADSGEQSYITAEPYAVKQQAGWAPQAFLLADDGYAGYATTIDTQAALVQSKPDLVQRFVDASILGWYGYLYGDNAAANRLIKTDNPDMTDGQIGYAIGAFKSNGIVLSGDAVRGGIGCMTTERYRRFYEDMVQAKVLKPGLDWQAAFTTRFVCHGIGKQLAPR